MGGAANVVAVEGYIQAAKGNALTQKGF